MNKNLALIVLGVAVVLGVASVVLVNKWLSAKAAANVTEVKKSVPMTRVVIAAQEILPGTRLTTANLAYADWPQSNVPKGAFDSIDAVKDRIAVSKLAAGQPLMAAELAAPGSGAGLVAIIAPGMRAMAIRVDEVIGVGGFILPNTYVDVIGVRQIGNNPNDKIADTLLRRIKVLAVAQETQTEEGKAKLVRTVTLEIRPRDAEKLALQVNLGPIHLVLRNPVEDDRPQLPETSTAVTRQVASQPIAPRAQTFRVEVIQGDRKPETYEFPSR